MIEPTLFRTEFSFRPRFWAKNIACLLLAFGISQGIVTWVLYAEAPVFRPQFLYLTSQLSHQFLVSTSKFGQTDASQSGISFIGKFGKPTSAPILRIPEQDSEATVPAVPVNPTHVPGSDVVIVVPTDTPKPTMTLMPTMTPKPTITAYPTTIAPTDVPVPTDTPIPQPKGSSPSSQAKQLLDLINAERQRQGIGMLAFNDKLNSAAQQYANMIGSRTICSHTEGSTLQQRFQQVGYQSYGGENITCGISDPSAAFNAWMKSPGHHDNMLNSAYRSAGLGYANGYWVLDLGAI